MHRSLKQSVAFICALALFFSGSFFSKQFLDRQPETRFHLNYVHMGLMAQKIRLSMFGQDLAIAQYFLFRLILNLGAYDLPPAHGHEEEAHSSVSGDSDCGKSCKGDNTEEDCNADDIHLHHHDLLLEDFGARINRYKLHHVREFFDLNYHCRLMDLIFRFDPKEETTRLLGVGFSFNAEIATGMIEVLEKLWQRDRSWRVAFDIGWLYFFLIRDYDKARLWLKQAMEFPAIPAFVREVYLSTFEIDRKYDLAIRLLEEQLGKTYDFDQRDRLQKRLIWYKSLNLLLKKSSIFEKQYNKPINHLNDLVEAGLIEAIPEDPFGGGFYWDLERKEPFSKDRFFMEKVVDREKLF